MVRNLSILYVDVIHEARGDIYAVTLLPTEYFIALGTQVFVVHCGRTG